MRRCVASLFVVVLLLSACSAPGGNGQHCGTWQTLVAAQDPRVMVEQVPGATDAQCATTFRLTSHTKAFGIVGGYTLALSPDSTTRMRPLEWNSLPKNHPEQLIPGRFSTLRLTPDGGSAGITLVGTITSDSLKTDAALFLIRSALDLLNLPGSCVIPPELILGAATDTSATLASVGDALAAHNAADAADKMRSLSDSFLTQATEYLKMRAPQCAANSLVRLVALVTGFSGVTFIAKAAVNFATWAASVFQDVTLYHNQPVRVTMKYAPVV